MDTAWNVDDYKVPGEEDNRWQRRRSFMTTHKGQMKQLELVFLSQLFTNIEFMCCKYPEEAMHQMGILPQAEMEHELRKTTTIMPVESTTKKPMANRPTTPTPKKTPTINPKKAKVTTAQPKKTNKAAGRKKNTATTVVSKKTLRRTMVKTRSMVAQSKKERQAVMRAYKKANDSVDLRVILQSNANTSRASATSTPRATRCHSPITFDFAEKKMEPSHKSSQSQPAKRTKLSHEAMIPSSSFVSANASNSSSAYYSDNNISSYYNEIAHRDYQQHEQQQRDYEDQTPYVETTMQQPLLVQYQQQSITYPTGQEQNNHEYYAVNSHHHIQSDCHDISNQHKNLIVLDWGNPEELRRSFNILNNTAQYHGRPLRISYRKPSGGGLFYCTVELGGIMAATSSHPARRDQARTMACNMLLSLLQLDCHTIQSKADAAPRRTIRIDADYIDANQRTFDNRLTADNKGFQMMRQLGWRGGALGTNGTGIAEPIQVHVRARRRGLGVETDSAKVVQQRTRHWEFFDNYLHSYAQCEDNVAQLAVHMNYTPLEWRSLTEIVIKCGLKPEFCNNGERQFLTIEKPITPTQIAFDIMRGGVYADFYNLLPPTRVHS